MPKKAQVPGGQVGVRLNPRQDERCRSAIQTTLLLQRLNAFALQREDPRIGRIPDMTDGQIRAAVALLRKTMPDLAVTTHTGPDGEGIPVIQVLFGTQAAQSDS
jgi:hypothetical protein